MRIPFGKYAGLTVQELAETDFGYLQWFEENVTNVSKKLRAEINYHIGLKTGKSASRGFVSKTAAEAEKERSLR